MRTFCKLTLLLALVFSSSFAVSQTFDLDKGRLPIVSISGLWRFHTGDDPAWSTPGFDDSGWSLLRSDRPWDEQGFKGYRGFAWYRFKIAVPAKIHRVSFGLPPINRSLEIFADGVLIGSNGKMPPYPSAVAANPNTVYTVPTHTGPPAALPRTICIAIRVWFSPPPGDLSGGGAWGPWGTAGDTTQIEDFRNMGASRAYWSQMSSATITLLQSLAALAALILFSLRRTESEYLWFSLMIGCNAACGWIFLSTITGSWNVTTLYLTNNLLSDAALLAGIAFYVRLLRPRQGLMFKVVVACTLLEIPSSIQLLLFPGLINATTATIIGDLLDVPRITYILVVLVIAAREKSVGHSQWIDARLLLIPYLMSTLLTLFDEVAWATWMLGWQRSISDGDITLIEHPFDIRLDHVTATLSLLAIFAILVLRFARTRSEQERYATEVEGARSVQQFLIPKDLPATPGFTIDADYRPAREVGGDFFQVIPDSTDESTLIFVGDVAGKGLQAGMLATLLVGAIRTAATFSRDPAVILSTLNNRLCGNGNATCIALRIASDGAVRLINAGHLPPYLNGRELPMEGALPLGTIPNIDFPILQFSIAQGEILTLISDGILEAQKPTGELFGFERIANHLKTSTKAATLANAAQIFGQSDDITVMTIARANLVV